ncbi:DUF3703 domain-containing protein [Novosphingobium sp. PS1R-30]|uniref:DUF3703 domain-containing protein n=1 Tax=Novosphingobium anseongense TaxID=3133436 RepID=A0ABU8RWY9_9SPHN
MTVTTALAKYREASVSGDVALAWESLEHAHILAQPRLGAHLRVHFAMLGFSITQRDPVEAAGQVLRLLLAPLGAATGRVPTGNIGRSNVSAFAPMAVPPGLQASNVEDQRP